MKKALFFLLSVLWTINVLGQNPIMNITSGSDDEWGVSRWIEPNYLLLPGFNFRNIPPNISLSIRDRCEIVFLDDDIFYINRTNQICRLHFNGNNWIINQPLMCNPSAVLASSKTQMISNNADEIYYIGMTSSGNTDGIYELYVIKKQGESFTCNPIPQAE